MGKRCEGILKALLLVAAIAVLTPLQHSTAETLNNEVSMSERNEIEDILFTFFNAQVEGDTATIKRMIGGNLENKLKGLLNNPSYSDFLIKTYQDADLRILNCKKLPNGSILVDAMVLSDNRESTRQSFLLVRQHGSSNSGLSYLIHSQEIIVGSYP